MELLLAAESTAEYKLAGVTVLLCCLLHAHRNGNQLLSPPQRRVISSKMHQQPVHYYTQAQRPLNDSVYNFCTSQTPDTINGKAFCWHIITKTIFWNVLETNLGLKTEKIAVILISSWEEGKYNFIPFGEYRNMSFIF